MPREESTSSNSVLLAETPRGAGGGAELASGGQPRLGTIEHQVVTQVTDEIKRSLAIDEVPPDVEQMIGAAAREAAGSVTKQTIQQLAFKATRKVVGAGTGATRVSDGRERAVKDLSTLATLAKSMSESAAMQTLLQQNARMLADKMKALIDAGFTNQQAFRLILAEVTAKAER